jgi:hypothetical protein
MPSTVVEGTYKTLTVKGRTYTNLLGSDGDCESTSGWLNFFTSHVLDSSNKVFNSYGFKVSLTQSGTYALYKPKSGVSLDPSKYYMFSIYLKNGNLSNGMRVYTEVSNQHTDFVTGTTFKRVALILTPSSVASTTNFDIQLNGNSGEYGYVDGVMLNEITADEKNTLTVDQIMERYPYINGTASTGPMEIKSVGKNLFDKSKIKTGIYGIADGLYHSEYTSYYCSQGFIRVKPGANLSTNCSVVVYDINKNVLPQWVSGALPSNCYYITVYCLKTAIDSVQIEYGSTATIYEPYKESTSYTDAELNSLPNGVCDTVDLVSGLYTQNTKKYILQSADIITMQTGTNVDYAIANKPIDYIGYGTYYGNNTKLEGKNELFGLPDATSSIGYYATNLATNNIYVAYAKGTTLTQAQTDLAGKNLIYQLAEPDEPKQLKPQPLLAHSGGSIIISHRVIFAAKPASGVITVPVDKQKWPIKSIVSVKKYVGGIASEDATVSAFTTTTVTLTGADNTAEYQVIYDYPPELSTLPTINISYPMNLKAAVETNTTALNNIEETLWNFILSQV